MLRFQGATPTARVCSRWWGGGRHCLLLRGTRRELQLLPWGCPEQVLSGWSRWGTYPRGFLRGGWHHRGIIGVGGLLGSRAEHRSTCLVSPCESSLGPVPPGRPGVQPGWFSRTPPPHCPVLTPKEGPPLGPPERRQRCTACCLPPGLPPANKDGNTGVHGQGCRPPGQ